MDITSDSSVTFPILYTLLVTLFYWLLMEVLIKQFPIYDFYNYPQKVRWKKFKNDNFILKVTEYRF